MMKPYEEELAYRWLHFVHSLGGEDEGATLFFKICQAYSEKVRAYHTLKHIMQCLTDFDEVSDQCIQPEVVEAALWFHDIIYDPKSTENKRLSADLAGVLLPKVGMKNPSRLSLVRDYILETKTHPSHAEGDLAYLLDIDIGVLGYPEKDYIKYMDEIRLEYAHVPDAYYIPARTKIIKSFFERPRIYLTDHFFKKYEAQANSNLQLELHELTQKAPPT